MDIAKPALQRSTCFRNGNPSTSITAENFKKRRESTDSKHDALESPHRRTPRRTRQYDRRRRAAGRSRTIEQPADHRPVVSVVAADGVARPQPTDREGCRRRLLRKAWHRCGAPPNGG